MNFDSQSGPISTLSALNDWDAMILEKQYFSSGATCNTFKVLYDEHLVFLKRLKPELAINPSYVNLFQKEYEVGSHLHSEYFPRYIDYTDEGGCPIIMMEYVDGMTLEQLLDENPGYFRSKQNLNRFVRQMLTALVHLHSQHVVHLDLKPGNIIITRVNRDVRIVDLGFCYTDSQPFTQGRTDKYAAPEQFTTMQHVDARTDIFAFGKVLEQILHKSNVSNKLLSRVAHRCTAEEPARRYQSAADILRELNSVILRHRLSIVSIFLVFVASVVSWFFLSRLNHYDFTYKCHHDDVLYFNILRGGEEVELTYKWTWGNNYPADIVIPSEIVHDGRRYTVTAIHDSTFMASSLNAVTLPTTIRRIGERAFADCNRISTITIPEGVTQLGECAFAGCKSLQMLHLPTTLKQIPRGCFVDDAIKSLFIPEGVERICQDAFVGNNHLVDVHFPSTLTTLDRGVFYHCASLPCIDIPASVTTLGDYLLFECPMLKKVILRNPTPVSCTGIVDAHFKGGTLYVPSSSLDAYRQAQGYQNLDIKAIR